MVPRCLRLRRITSFTLVILLAAVGPATAQEPHAPQFGLGLGVTAQFVVSLFFTLVFGAIIVAVAPDFLRTIVSDVRESPGEMAIYGLAAVVGGFVAIVVLAITIIGLVVAVPGAIAFGLYVAVTSLISTIAVGYLLLDSVSGATLWSGLVVGALLSAVLSVIPVVGGIVSFVVGLFGIGAVSKRLYDSYRG